MHHNATTTSTTSSTGSTELGVIRSKQLLRGVLAVVVKNSAFIAIRLLDLLSSLGSLKGDIIL